MPDTYSLYRSLTSLPLGKAAFSFLFAQKAPYFWTVRPQVREVRKHHAELTIRKRRAVQKVMDACSAEITRRYRDGEADVDALLSESPADEE